MPQKISWGAVLGHLAASLPVLAVVYFALIKVVQAEAKDALEEQIVIVEDKIETLNDRTYAIHAKQQVFGIEIDHIKLNVQEIKENQKKIRQDQEEIKRLLIEKLKTQQ